MSRPLKHIIVILMVFALALAREILNEVMVGYALSQPTSGILDSWGNDLIWCGIAGCHLNFKYTLALDLILVLAMTLFMVHFFKYSEKKSVLISLSFFLLINLSSSYYFLDREGIMVLNPIALLLIYIEYVLGIGYSLYFTILGFSTVIWYSLVMRYLPRILKAWYRFHWPKKETQKS